MEVVWILMASSLDLSKERIKLFIISILMNPVREIAVNQRYRRCSLIINIS